MTSPTKCPHCGTALADAPDIGHTHLEVTKDGPYHSTARCLSVVLAQRDEAIDIALMIGHAPNFPNATDALERLRGHGK